MTIIAHIGKILLDNNKLNTLTEEYEKDIFNSKFFMLYTGGNIFKHLNLIVNNQFYSQGTKVLVMHLYSKIQKVVFALKKFVRYVKWKKAIISSVETDLFMNSLCNFPENQKIQLLQKNTLYTFRITDFLKLWHTALCHSNSFSPTPRFPKNPYTNLKFNKGHLASCYVALYKTNFTIPPLITQFWNCSLDIDLFREEAYPKLKEAAVRNYVLSSGSEIIFYDIVAMISSLERQLNGRSVSMGLSNKAKAEFIYNMTPYLHKFLLYEHTCNPVKRRRLRRQVIKDLKNYFIKNPLSGRRVVFTSRPYSTNTTTAFSFINENITDGSIFVFGAGETAAEPMHLPGDTQPLPSDQPYDEVEELDDVEDVEDVEEETYNEVLDDSDDSEIQFPHDADEENIHDMSDDDDDL